MKYLILVAFLVATSAMARPKPLRPMKASVMQVRDDVDRILNQAEMDLDFITFDKKYSIDNGVKVTCKDEKVKLEVRAVDSEWASVLYYGLHKLGFLFPHPRIQINPTKKEILKHCNKKYYWRPAFQYRGLHLHTMHPSEWVHGFLMGETQIAVDTIRWLARNQQNVVDVSLLEQDEETIFKNLKTPFELAKNLGIHTGIGVGASLMQQNSYRLISSWRTFFDGASLTALNDNLDFLLKNLDVSFINMEMGTSEFTSTNYERSIKWMNEATKITDKHNVRVFTKIHVSSNQKHKKYGNFNFLPEKANEDVGVLPHTVFTYGLYNKKAPMYGNENFHHIRDFIVRNKRKRNVWYYPETSYFVAIDIDAPLFLTDYLVNRATDMRGLYFSERIPGHFNFTTGNELGYWLFDWSVMLLNNRDYNFDPMTALKLLGEDLDAWLQIINFQKKFFADEGLISVISFSNFGDEFFPAHKIHERNLLSELAKDRNLLWKELQKLERAMRFVPDTTKVKNDELRLMLDVTFLRIRHAQAVRRALFHKDSTMKRYEYLRQAMAIRRHALKKMDFILKNFNRYPDSWVYAWHPNPTAYQHGYGLTAVNLFFWLREEWMVRDHQFSPFFMNMYDFLDIAF
jgi:hypothetical protein